VLDGTAAASAFAPSAPIWLLSSFSAVMVALCLTASASEVLCALVPDLVTAQAHRSHRRVGSEGQAQRRRIRIAQRFFR
jgi:hypothetical protein